MFNQQYRLPLVTCLLQLAMDFFSNIARQFAKRIATYNTSLGQRGIGFRLIAGRSRRHGLFNRLFQFNFHLVLESSYPFLYNLFLLCWSVSRVYILSTVTFIHFTCLHFMLFFYFVHLYCYLIHASIHLIFQTMHSKCIHIFQGTQIS